MWQIFDCTFTLVNVHVFEILVLFTFTVGVDEGKKTRENSAAFFIVNILVKDVMNLFTDGRQDTHSHIFRLKREKWKIRKSYRSDSPPFEHHASYPLINKGYLRRGA